MLSTGRDQSSSSRGHSGGDCVLVHAVGGRHDRGRVLQKLQVDGGIQKSAHEIVVSVGIERNRDVRSEPDGILDVEICFTPEGRKSAQDSSTERLSTVPRVIWRLRVGPAIVLKKGVGGVGVHVLAIILQELLYS